MHAKAILQAKSRPRPPTVDEISENPTGNGPKFEVVIDFRNEETHSRWLAAFGTDSTDFMRLQTRRLMDLIHVDGTISHQEMRDRMNGLLAAVAGIGPRNEIEALLAVQMVAVHFASMGCFFKATVAGTPERREAALGVGVKLSRTFAAQLEALRKFRDGGQQRVTVEHVHVEAGGKAVVGVIQPGGVGETI